MFYFANMLKDINKENDYEEEVFDACMKIKS